jgi:hypothetical protein
MLHPKGKGWLLHRNQTGNGAGLVISPEITKSTQRLLKSQGQVLKEMVFAGSFPVQQCTEACKA